MPSHFAKKNQNDAPALGIIVSCIGIVPLLYLTLNANISQQISAIIDFSVVAFLFVYLICVLAYIKRLYQEQASVQHWIYSILACLFCLWTISQTPWTTILTSMVFSLSGLPVYLFWYRKRFMFNKLEHLES
jgi:APA family basic amino acid/polyamine antiporter